MDPGLSPATGSRMATSSSSRTSSLPGERLETSPQTELADTLEAPPAPLPADLIGSLSPDQKQSLTEPPRTAKTDPAVAQTALVSSQPYRAPKATAPVQELNQPFAGTLSVPARISQRLQGITTARHVWLGLCGGPIARQLLGPGHWSRVPESSFRPSNNSAAVRLALGPPARRPLTLRFNLPVRTNLPSGYWEAAGRILSFPLRTRNIQWAMRVCQKAALPSMLSSRVKPYAASRTTAWVLTPLSGNRRAEP